MHNVDHTKQDRLRARLLYWYARAQGDVSIRIGARTLAKLLDTSPEDTIKTVMRSAAYVKGATFTIDPSGCLVVFDIKKEAKQSSVREVYDYWVTKFNKKRTKLTADRRAKISARFKEGYTVDDIKRAIDGCAASPWHMGENDSFRSYCDLTLICRSGSRLEQFWEYLETNCKLDPASIHGEEDLAAWFYDPETSKTASTAIDLLKNVDNMTFEQWLDPVVQALARDTSRDQSEVRRDIIEKCGKSL